VVDIWDGNEWRTVDNFRVTGRYQKMLRVALRSGDELNVTPYHKMVLADGTEVEAKDLLVNDKLLISNAPITYGLVREPGAYIKGFLLGDGTYSSTGERPELWLYPPKKVCADRLLASVLELEGKNVRTNAIAEAGFRESNYSSERNVLVMQGMTPVKESLYPWVKDNKRKLPSSVFAWDMESKANFIAGLFDADGSVMDTANGFGYQISSIYRDFLLDVKYLLMSMGIKSKLSIMKHAGKADFRDGYGSYESKDAWRITVSQAASIALSKIVKFERLKNFSDRSVTYVVKPTYNQVVSIDESGIEEEVYCCTVDRTHRLALTCGVITGQCGEQMLPPYVSCNLGSIDLSRFVIEKKIDWQSLDDAVRGAVSFLDDSLDSAFWPVEEVQVKTAKYRNIGLGVMGWSDMCIMLGLAYDSDAAVELGDEVMCFINSIADDESMLRGSGNRKNVTVTSIAPTGSISMLAGCSSGIEPLFGIVTTKNTYVGSFHNVHWLFEKIAKEQGFYSDELIKTIAERGSVQGLSNVPTDVQELFKTTTEIDWEWHVRHQAAFQKHTENAVSKTINMASNARVFDVSAAYMTAYETGCKSITVYRDGSRQVQVMDNKSGTRDMCPNCKAILFMKDGEKVCVTCGYKKASLDESINLVSEVKRARPAHLNGTTYRKDTPIGKAYVTVNTDAQGEPFEVFMNVGKAGSEVAAVSEGLGRLISLVLRMPSSVTPVERLRWIVDEISDIGGGRPMGFGAKRVRSLPDGIAQVLSEHLSGGNDTADESPVASTKALGDICPECGEATLLNVEGCRKCQSCGYSEC